MRKRRKRRGCRALLTAVILMISMFFVPKICAHASSCEDILENMNPPSAASIQGYGSASAGSSASSGYPAFWVVIQNVKDDEIAAFCTAAYVADTDGSTYLITSEFAAALDSSEDYSLNVWQSDYVAPAEVVAVQDGIAYLSADGIEAFPAFKLGRNWDEVEKDAYLWYLNMDDSGESKLQCDAVGDLSNYENDGTDYYLSEFQSDYARLMGTMIANDDASSIIGIMTLDSNYEYVVMKNMDQIQHPKAAAVTTGNSAEAGENDDRANDAENDSESDNKDTKDAPTQVEERTGIVSEIPYWAWVAAVIVLIGFFVSRNNSRKNKSDRTNAKERKDSARSEGTICLDQQESAEDAGKTMQTVISQPAGFLVRGISGVFQGQIFPVNGRLRFGRSNDSDVMFPQGTKGISGKHCEIYVENGRIVLRDTGSSFGTYMGQGVKIVPDVVYYLSPGDEFYLADRTQLFRLESSSANVSPNHQRLSVRGTGNAYPGQTFYAAADGRMYFGRGEGSQVHFSNQDTGVSTTHCVLYQEGDSIYLMDMNSMNGTFKEDGTRLRPNVPYHMNVGDKFYLVNKENTFCISGK